METAAHLLCHFGQSHNLSVLPLPTSYSGATPRVLWRLLYSHRFLCARGLQGRLLLLSHPYRVNPNI